MPPKTASNSIRVLLEQHGYIFSKDSKHLNYPQIHLKLSEIVDFYNVGNLDEYKIIQITRNPYHRYISSFFFQKRIVPQNFSVKFKNYNLIDFSEHLLSSKGTNDFINSFYGDSSFVDYNINNGISWGGSRFYDKQVDWNDLDSNIKYFKLEDINNNISELKNFLGLPIKGLPLINSQNLTFDYLTLITPRIKEIIIELFNEDFTSLNYSK